MIIKMKKTAILSTAAFILIFFCNGLFAEDNNHAKRFITLYDFTSADNIDKGEKKYRYYSRIIPETISKSLQKYGNYSIKRDAAPPVISDDFGSKSAKKQYIKKIRELDSKYKSDFVVTGKYSISDKALVIVIIVSGMTSEDVKVIEHKSAETGVQLQDTTDTISRQIHDEISAFESKKGVSPFIALYRPFSLLSTGIDGGYLFLQGDWKSAYNNKPYISPFINIDVTDNFFLSARLIYLQTDTENKEYLYYSEARLFSISLSLCYRFKLFGGLWIAFSAGGGATATDITVNPPTGGGGPFDNSFITDERFEFNADASSYFVYDISPVSIRAGVHGKRIFYSEEPMDILAVFGGIGFHF